jgi:hypothetical protein
MNIIGVKNLNRVSLRASAILDDDMAKYSTTKNLTAGAITRVVTTITTEPYSLLIQDSEGVVIDPPAVYAQFVFDGGVWNLDLYSVEALTGVKIKITY